MSFNLLSIDDWTRVAHAAGVPYVPAIPVATISKEHIGWFEEAESRPEVMAALKGFFDKVTEAERDHPDHMLRWDFCAPSDLKSAMARSRGPGKPQGVWFTPDDPRFGDILGLDWERDTVTAYRRPWVPARIVEGYPEEYRVFVENGEVIAISSYYPQRPLEDTPGRRATLATAREHSRRLTSAAPWPLGPGTRLAEKVSTERISCTLDFMVVEDGSLVFLEGGPPWRPRWGASPCCFAEGEVRGIALEAQPGSRGYKPPGVETDRAPAP